MLYMWGKGAISDLFSLLQNTLCNTALDNPTFRSKDQMITAALKYLETDTIWYAEVFVVA